MIIKPGVKVNGLRPEMIIVLIVAGWIWADRGQRVVLTEGTGAKHSLTSRHYIGFAVDLRTNYFSEAVANSVSRELQTALGKEYKVVLHKTHIHTQFNGSANG